MNLITVALPLILCAILMCANAEERDPSEQVYWRFCTPINENDKTTKIFAEDIMVWVKDCNSSNNVPETPCILRKGSNPVMTLNFKSTKSIPNVERLMIGKTNTILGYAEVPHGPAVGICSNINSTIAAMDGSEPCQDEGVVAGKSYHYVSTFKVLESTPSTKDIATKVVLRQSRKKHAKLSRYRTHPGPHVLCLVIPNMEVDD